MAQLKMWFADRHKRDDALLMLILLLFGLVFFVRNAHLELALDDIGWLRGETPTVFDRYRHLPRFFFTSLYALFGPNAVAALIMIYSFHVVNTLLVHRLCLALTDSPVAARVAAFVFSVNPITLATLTWISCFSYVLGTSLALTSLLAFWKSIAGHGGTSLAWRIVALACYVAALFCSHEVFFLPVLFLLLSWIRGPSWRPGAALLGVAMGFAVLVHLFVYDFGRYGVQTTGLFTPGFVSAFLSSALSFGLSLGLAYPLSFFVKPTGFLRTCFAEPCRWAMTLLLSIGGLLFYRPTRAWRTWLALALSFAALIAPYIIRLYLTPDSVSYHISYVLSGRVFYLPFAIVAMVLGGIVWKVLHRAKVSLVFCLLIAMAYLHALLVLYDKTDFMGLQVLRGEHPNFPPSWTPYADGQPAWFIGSLVVVVMVVILRFARRRWRELGFGSGATDPD